VSGTCGTCRFRGEDLERIDYDGHHGMLKTGYFLCERIKHDENFASGDNLAKLAQFPRLNLRYLTPSSTPQNTLHRSGWVSGNRGSITVTQAGPKD